MLKKKGRPIQVAPFAFVGSRPNLEFKSDCQLHLPFAEQGAVRAGCLAKRSVGDQTRSQSAGAARRRGREVIERAVNSGDLRAIQEVKGFSEDFDLCLFTDREASGNAQVEVLNRRSLEEVTR